MGIMGVDWGVQETGFLESTNPRRLVTGFCGGLGLFAFYGWLVHRLWNMEKKCFVYRKIG